MAQLTWRDSAELSVPAEWSVEAALKTDDTSDGAGAGTKTAAAMHTTGDTKREVRMYWPMRGHNSDPASNIKLVQDKSGGLPVSDVITGVILCCNDPKIDYTVPAPHFSGTDISVLVAAYRKANLTVHVCLNLKPATMTPEAVTAARASIPTLVSWATAQAIDGVVVDYEPSKNYSTAHVDAYASFLHELGVGMREHDMEAACDLASWGILDKYSAFVPAQLDFVTTMSTCACLIRLASYRSCLCVCSSC